MNRIFAIIFVAALAVSIGCGKQRASEKSATGSESQNAQSTEGGASPGGTGKLNSADQDFVLNVAKGGQAEVELGRVASERATNPSVKQFAEKMVTDHIAANSKLQQVAQAKGITLPNEAPDEENRLKQQLTQMNGPEFDRTYMQHMVQDHQKDVSEFQREASDAQDPDIKNFAASTLPTLKQHLELAQTTEKKLKK
jgi:putative membrane protein